MNAAVTKAELLPLAASGGVGGDAIVEFEPKFDSSFSGISTRYMQLQDGDRNAFSSSSNAAACTLAGGFTKGKASWEFQLIEDTTSQCSCFGMAIKPIVDFNYSSSLQMMLYRAFSGQRYNRGRAVSNPTMPKVNKGDRIRFDLDMDLGICNIAVNGRPCGIGFDGLKGLAIWPCAYAYSSNRTIRILSISGPPEFANGCRIIGVAGGKDDVGEIIEGSSGSVGVRVGPLGQYHRTLGALHLDVVPEAALYVPAGVLGRRGAEGAHPDDDAPEGVVAQVQIRSTDNGIDGDLPRQRPGQVGNAAAGMDADRLRTLRKKNVGAPDHSLSMRVPEEKECLRQVGGLSLAEYPVDAEGKEGEHDDSAESKVAEAEVLDDPDDPEGTNAGKSTIGDTSGAPSGPALRALRAAC